MPLTFHLIPHTHWDREWYLPRAAFHARLVPVLDDLLAQLERDASARFVLDGQTVLLEDYLAVRPEAAPRLAAAVRRGALEVGPWYVLADMLIPDGESLLRNLLEGTRDAERFGKRLDVLYSPDAFGQPGALPALAEEFGLRFAAVRRGLGRPLGRDRDLYRWATSRGGGGGPLTYHLPRPGYEVAIELTRAGVDLRRAWTAVRGEVVARAATDQIAVFLGADHHPAYDDLAGLRDRLQALEPGPEVRISGLTEFFAEVERAAPTAPVIAGELRRIDGHTWVLQGVHGTRSRLKRRHSRTELALARLAEPLAGLLLEQQVQEGEPPAQRRGDDRAGLLRLAWRSLMQSQFHDTLCGSCSDDVAREQEVRLGAVEALTREIATGALYRLAGHDPDLARERPDRVSPQLVLWNPCARERSGIVTAELSFHRREVLVGPPPEGRKPMTGKGYQPFWLKGPSGAAIPVQVLSVRRGQERLDAARHHPAQAEVDWVRVAFRAPPLDGLGLSLLQPRGSRGSPADLGLEVREGLLANPRIAVGVSRTGAITIDDRDSGERYAGLCTLEDEPDAGDTYTFSRGDGRAAFGGRSRSHTVVAEGPLVGALETRWSLRSGGRGGGTWGSGSWSCCTRTHRWCGFDWTWTTGRSITGSARGSRSAPESQRSPVRRSGWSTEAPSRQIGAEMSSNVQRRPHPPTGSSRPPPARGGSRSWRPASSNTSGPGSGSWW